MRILYIGDDHPSSTSQHRADALRRLGCDLYVVNPQKLIGARNQLQAWLDYRTGFHFLQHKLLRSFAATLHESSFSSDLIWINGGELIGPRVLRWLQQKFECPTFLYNNDDPTGWRDGRRFSSLRAAISFYHLCASCRLETALEMTALGARRSLRVWMSFDELRHVVKPSALDLSLQPTVSFVGTCIPGEHRDQFLLTMAKAGLPLSFTGDRWHKSRLIKQLRPWYGGPAISGDGYVQAIYTPAISLGFLSHGNRDLVTRRSFETPACSGLLCAERTSEHQLLFEEGEEAVFWGSADECIDVCKSLLEDMPRNLAIRSAGLKYILEAGFGNEDICQQVLNSI